jgi:hypothetical protein
MEMDLTRLHAETMPQFVCTLPTMFRKLLALSAMTVSLFAAAQTPPPARVFYSGHSLMDQPLPAYLDAVAQSLGTPLQWNRQYMVGSAIRSRSAGDNPAQPWSGYRSGDNREGSGMDVLQEFKQPRTVTGGPYDTLLIAEQHGLLGTLIWNDTVRHLRHYHDRFIEASPKGRTWFYEAWLDVSDKGDPRAWIAHERAASLRWQCIAERINHSLKAEGRSDRIESLPAAAALVGMIERATSETGLPGVTRSSVRQTVDSVVSDNVHLTPLGSYYMSLVLYGYLFDRSPAGAWKPPEVSAEAAKSLQDTAWKLVQKERQQRQRLDVKQCDQLMRDFVAPYWGYARDTYKHQEGLITAYWNWAKRRWQWQRALSADSPSNPMRYDAATDKRFWLPPP